MGAKLVPELDVADLPRALRFYVEVCGFRIDYERPEEGFAYLERDGAESAILAAGYEPLIELERRTYRVRGEDLVTEQFVVADEDGYLLRFFTDRP